MIRKSNCYQKVVIRNDSCSREIGILKKIFLWKSNCLEWLLLFQYDWCCSENIAALIRICFIMTGVLKYAERNCVGQSGSLQNLTSEKCTVPFKEWMTLSILGDNCSTYSWQNYLNNRWLQVLLSNKMQYLSKNERLPFSLWQKQILYFKEWVAAITVVKSVDCP